MDVRPPQAPPNDASIEELATYHAQLTYTAIQGQSQLPIDLLRLCYRESIALKTRSLKCHMYADRTLDRHKQKVIALDECMSPQQQRFYLAKGIGYHLLQTAIVGQEEYTYVEYENACENHIPEPHSMFAELFAVELLAPYQLVQKLIDEDKTPIDIARELDISIPIVEKQIARLTGEKSWT